MPTWLPHSPYALTAAFVLGTLAVYRLTRLWIYDDFPPVRAIRLGWINAVGPASDWAMLATCPWCCSPWIALADLAWALGSGLHWTWWAFNAWMAAAGLAAMIYLRDTPPDPPNAD